MRARGRIEGRAVGRLLAIALPSLAAATALVWLLEDRFSVLDASPVYLLAVIVTALVSGTVGGLAAAVAGIALYDYLFTEPLHTLAISDPAEWLSLTLLLFVGVVVGQLTALQRSRALTAEAREQEARELFFVSRALATRLSTSAVLPDVATLLQRETGMRSLWISLGANDAAERVVAEAGVPRPVGQHPFHWALRRMPGDVPAQWIRIHGAGAGRAAEPAAGSQMFRVRIDAGSTTYGSIWATRDRQRGLPDRSATRLLSAAADQIGQVLAQDQLAAGVAAAEVARQSDALKSALLQSVSHDLRTPLATIRAAAGSLRPDSDLDAAGRAASAAAIEREVARLDRLVANLLDLGRIDAGALRANIEVHMLDDLAGRTVERVAGAAAGRNIQVDAPAIPVSVDPVFLDEALANLLDNALKFAGPEATIRVRAAIDGDRASLSVDDSGPGVPVELLGRVFDKFYRAPSTAIGVRPGTGIGLAVVKGLVDAMGGTVEARQSDLGGLSVVLSLPLAHLPAELEVTPA
jgi:two-component system sensor histidine kinase KdpD